MQLLLLSSSKVGNSGYLEDAQPQLYKHFSTCKNIVFISYAGVTMSDHDYTQKVKDALPDLPISGIYEYQNPASAIQACDGILVGGGNTFKLLDSLYQNGLIDIIRNAVINGVKYAGWSAGANIAGNSIRTTNDMPIVQPPSFDALQLVPFQLNPHYTEYQPPGHNGETREDRLREFMVVAPDMPVVGIPEGVALLRNTETLLVQGKLGAYIFSNGEKAHVEDQTMLSSMLA